MFDITIIGDVTWDNLLMVDTAEAELHCRRKNLECELCFTYGKKIPIREVVQSVGGNAANVAVASSRLGLKTSIITSIASDKTGLKILETLKSENINTANIQRLTDTDSNFSTIIVFKGERTILVHHQAIDYNLPEISTPWIYLTSMAAKSDQIHSQIIANINKNHSKLIFQPGTHQIRFGLKGLKNILASTEVFIANLSEFQQVLDLKEEKLNYSEDIKIRLIMEKLATNGPKIVILTNGLDGAYLLNDEHFYHINAWPNRQLVDQTGAGDAFASGFVSATILRKNVEQALQWGIANSGSVVESIGAQAGLLSFNEIVQIINKDQIPTVKSF
ncbi:MAG: hypothetical protein UT11_C0003G0008 [Berkelbacteria bacterium GW2011_GWA2_38_9]|uniref:Carbohydrate kinase PfkB domain-containing protein n=1 Tax=Berkelbacteria bacterium GW2011_GWA2_38_9 TaxID=1618334 RepID=A0A0G0NXD8_9BACT|nr:MAG: hypothetical protein UT11_C0003G0008 [Berkelbacteria bacterium GW2011_GWA2_38_9]